MTSFAGKSPSYREFSCVYRLSSEFPFSFQFMFRQFWMKEVQKIVQKVLLLLMDILIFTWQVVRKVILPTRSRKGNVFSSLLAFIVGLLERVVSFEKSILKRPVVFTHRYAKQGIVIAVGFLFLLSSFEWTIGPSAAIAGNDPPEAVAIVPAGGSIRMVTRRVNFSDLVSTGTVVAGGFFVPILSPSRSEAPVMPRRWLRFGVFRI
jgi:hypothetical protein